MFLTLSVPLECLVISALSLEKKKKPNVFLNGTLETFLVIGTRGFVFN